TDQSSFDSQFAPRRGAVVMPVGTPLFSNLDSLGAVARLTRATFAATVAFLLVLFAGLSTAQAQATSTITAAWDRNSDAVTTGYLVQYGTSAGNYQWSHDAGNNVQAQLTLSRGATYYFAVRAYTSSAQLGPASNE